MSKGCKDNICTSKIKKSFKNKHLCKLAQQEYLKV